MVIEHFFSILLELCSFVFFLLQDEEVFSDSTHSTGKPSLSPFSVNLSSDISMVQQYSQPTRLSKHGHDSDLSDEEEITLKLESFSPTADEDDDSDD